MLVCNVSLRPPRAGIAADIAEAAAALDTLGTGNVVFATLVDDPASVGEMVDAYLGEIMLEAASANDITDGNIPATYNLNVAESMTAVDTLDATVGVPVSYATWDAATVTAVTLSGGDLVATNTGTTSTNQGAHVSTATGKTTGKYYFEITFTTITSATGGNFGFGIGTTASTYANMGNNATTGDMVFNSGSIYAGGSNTGINMGGTPSNGSVISIAADLDNRKIWFRFAPSSNWNNSGTANPATNTGGITIPAGTMVPFVTFGGTGGNASNVITANFGGSAFSGAVPSGFTSGWVV